MITALSDRSLRAVRVRLEALYGPLAELCLDRFLMLVGRYGVGAGIAAAPYRWGPKDAVLISYGDSVQKPGEKPLATLDAFLTTHVGAAFNTLHLLPFFPYSSDDGFSVVHFRTVRPELGGWGHFQSLSARYRMMVDLVLNHVSRKSGWFIDFETGTAPGRHFILTADPVDDVSAVSRPRTHPLLTPVQTRSGLQHVWTTFSADQVDLDYRNPDVLFEMLDILLLYISEGARVIRLDAVAYLWKKIGTRCMHLTETHLVVQIMRALVDLVAPDVLLITETNVPDADNISYLGAGDEAHLVYQFGLPPLLLHALITGTARYLTSWAEALPPPPPGCTFLNFTASHDGIGVRPLRGLVPQEDADRLMKHVRARGGQVSMASDGQGGEQPYELNCTWFDAMGLADSAEDRLHVERLLCSQCVALSLRGVPALYIHTLTATPNDQAGFQATGMPRSLNRRAWQYDELKVRLDDPHSITTRVLQGCLRLLTLRAQHAAFHPDGPQAVLRWDERVLSLTRRAPDDSETLLVLANCTAQPVVLPEVPAPWNGALRDLLGARDWDASQGGLTLQPYQCMWLVRVSA